MNLRDSIPKPLNKIQKMSWVWTVRAWLKWLIQVVHATQTWLTFLTSSPRWFFLLLLGIVHYDNGLLSGWELDSFNWKWVIKINYTHYSFLPFGFNYNLASGSIGPVLVSKTRYLYPRNYILMSLIMNSILITNI